MLQHLSLYCDLEIVERNNTSAASLKAWTVCIFTFFFARQIIEAGCEHQQQMGGNGALEGVAAAEMIQQKAEPEAGGVLKGSGRPPCMALLLCSHMCERVLQLHDS